MSRLERVYVHVGTIIVNLIMNLIDIVLLAVTGYRIYIEHTADSEL